MKKGLRLVFGWPKTPVESDSETSPDEEGIKTFPPLYEHQMKEDSETSPDEEGIKTSSFEIVRLQLIFGDKP